MNMLLLGAFTVAQAFLVGMITAYYNIEVGVQVKLSLSSVVA
jgi:hypothetical protein